MRFLIGIFSFFLLSITNAFAHVGEYSHTVYSHSNNFLQGLVHPFIGVQHLIMFIALGMLMYFFHGKSNKKKLVSSALILALLAVGYIFSSVVSIESIEIPLAMSLLIVSIAIWVSWYKNVWAYLSMVLSILMIFFHGYSHGVGLNGYSILFLAGLLISTVFILFCGERLARLFTSKSLALVIGMLSSGIIIILN